MNLFTIESNYTVACAVQPPAGWDVVRLGVLQASGIFAVSVSGHSCLPVLRNSMRDKQAPPLRRFYVHIWRFFRANTPCQLPWSCSTFPPCHPQFDTSKQGHTCLSKARSLMLILCLVLVSMIHPPIPVQGFCEVCVAQSGPEHRCAAGM